VKRYVLACVALIEIAAGAAGAVEVVSCGQVIAAGEVGTLSAALDCSTAPSGSRAVAMGNRATLQLQGNSITAPPDGIGVACDGRKCTIEGPGWLLAAPLPQTSLAGVVAAKNVVVSGGLEIYRNQTGVLCVDGTARLSGLILRANGIGVDAKVVKAERIFVIDSERTGIAASRSVRGEAIEVRGSGWAGIATRGFKIDGLVATTNGYAGTTSGGAVLATRRGTLLNSLLSANAFNGVPLDLTTGRAPKLIDSSCEHSAMLLDGAPSGTWGVCSFD